MSNPFNVDELSGLLLNKFGYIEKEIERLPEMEKSLRESSDFEEKCGEEEIYIQGQMVASQARSLKRYYSNPTEHNLLKVKSEIAGEIHPRLSPLGINYLKTKFVNVTRTDEMTEEEYQSLLLRVKKQYEILSLQERVLATPDEIWKETLQKTAERFKFVRGAPSYEGDEILGENVLDYYRTLEIEGDITEFLSCIIKCQKKSVEETSELMKKFGINSPVSSTVTLGRELEEIDYLERKGLDGCVSYCPPSVVFRADKKGTEHLMRFFVHTQEFHGNYRNDTSASEVFDWFRQAAFDNKLVICRLDEKIKPIDIAGIETLDEIIEKVRKHPVL